MSIHGKCAHNFCGHCMTKDIEVDVLDKKCSEFLKFNTYEYKSYVKKFKKRGVINGQNNPND